MHLDDRRWRAWLEGTLSPGDAEALGSHLALGCDACERVIGSMPAESGDLIAGVADDLWGDEADLDEAEVDRALASVMGRIAGAATAPAPPHPMPWYDALPFEHRTASPRRGVRRPGRAGMLVAGGVLAAGLAALVAVPSLRESGPADRAGWDGLKGAAATAVVLPEVSVSFAVARSGKVIRPGRDGDALPADADLLFRFRVQGGPAHLALVRETGAQREVVWPLAGAVSRPVTGEVDLAVDGVVQGVSLTGLSGPVRFVAVATERALPRPLAGPFPPGQSATAAVTVRVEADGP